MPSIVREVSAMLVASTILRAPGGVTSKIFDCTAFTAAQWPVIASCRGQRKAVEKEWSLLLIMVQQEALPV